MLGSYKPPCPVWGCGGKVFAKYADRSYGGSSITYGLCTSQTLPPMHWIWSTIRRSGQFSSAFVGSQIPVFIVTKPVWYAATRDCARFGADNTGTSGVYPALLECWMNRGRRSLYTWELPPEWWDTVSMSLQQAGVQPSARSSQRALCLLNLLDQSLWSQGNMC